MACSACGLNKPIQNKKYNLCSDCVFKKSHGGKSRQEVYNERATERQTTIDSRMRALYAPSHHKYKPPRQQRPEERVIKQKLSEIKTEIEMEAIHNDQYFCWGCGISHPGLDKSHILSVGKYKRLELDPDNMNLFCRDCHVNWESGVIERILSLNSLEKDLQYIQTQDMGAYGVIINKIHHFLRWNQHTESQLVRKAEKILKIFGETVA